MTDMRFMRVAFEQALEAIRNGQAPFAACLVRSEQIVTCVHNTVWESMDITAHAEMNAIREGCRELGAICLEGCVMYATCQPCPMCFAACQRAGIGRIVYSVRGEDARRIGFGERATPMERRQPYLSDGSTEIVADFLREEGLEVLEEWLRLGDGRTF